MSGPKTHYLLPHVHQEGFVFLEFVDGLGRWSRRYQEIGERWTINLSLVSFVSWSHPSRTILCWTIWMMGCETVADHQILAAELLLMIKELIILSVQWTEGEVSFSKHSVPFFQYLLLWSPSSCKWACPSWVPVRLSYVNLGLKDSPESSRSSPVLIYSPATAEICPLAGLGLSFRRMLSLFLVYFLWNIYSFHS